MQSNIIDRIKNLLNRAGHPSTPIEEARSCAVIAAKLYYKHQIEFTDQTNEPVNQGIHDNDPWKDAVAVDTTDSDNWADVETFRTIIAKLDGICKSCSKKYYKGTIVAWARDKGATHHGCRRFWINGQVRT